jgi:uncharacterized protein (TIGR00369 family)
MKTLPRYPRCFVCGKDNPLGLNLRFTVTEEKDVVTEFTPSEHYMGFKNILHGGIISSVLDEAMGWAITAHTGKLYVTTELTTKFKRPAPVGQKLIVRANALLQSGNGADGKVKRLQRAEASLSSIEGEIFAEASGNFFEIPEKNLTEVLGYLEKEDGSKVETKTILK